MAGELDFTATFHRPFYQAMPTPQQAYVYFEAMPTSAAPATGALPVNFSLVLDRSGSMAGEKMRHMKEAAKKIVDRLGEQDLLSVIVFDDADPADLVIPSSPVTDKDKVKRRIDAIQERGGTHMSTGMQLGFLELQKGQSANIVSSMLLLTDGQTWEDQDACRQLADNCQSAGIPINVLGMGVGEESNWDPRLLEDIAQRSGGEWVIVDSPEKVSTVFEQTLMAMQGTAVSNAHLTIRLAEGSTPRFVWRVTPLISRLDHHAVSAHDVQVFLGDIQHGIGQSILADVLVPPRPAGAHRLLQADITYDVPGSGTTAQKISVDAVVDFTDDAAKAAQVNGRVMNIIERVVAHKLQTQALDEAAAGDAARATQRLRAAATRLLEIGQSEMAQQASEQADKIEQGGQIDLESAQKMRFATKRLTESELEG